MTRIGSDWDRMYDSTKMQTDMYRLLTYLRRDQRRGRADGRTDDFTVAAVEGD